MTEIEPKSEKPKPAPTPASAPDSTSRAGPSQPSPYEVTYYQAPPPP